MDFNSYQEDCLKTAKYPDLGNNMWYPALGLAGEAGEVCNKVKKIYRDNGGKITAEVKEKLKSELGDCTWYISMLAYELGLNLEDIARENTEKLFGRAARGTIQGDGDNR